MSIPMNTKHSVLKGMYCIKILVILYRWEWCFLIAIFPYSPLEHTFCTHSMCLDEALLVSIVADVYMEDKKKKESF